MRVPQLVSVLVAVAGVAHAAGSGATNGPPGPAEIDKAIRARRFVLLVEKQESLDPELSAREWPYEGVYRANGEIPIGYRVGGTAICAGAIVDASRGKPEGDARAAVSRALEFVLAALEQPLMASGFEGTYDVRGWGHAYALDFLLRMRRAKLVPEARREDVDRRVVALVDTLQRTAIAKRGGWNYARGKAPDDCAPSTFMTAPTLLALFEARRDGLEVDASVVESALAELEAGRHENGAYQYAVDRNDTKSEGFDAIEGAIGRSPICEATLLLAGRGDEKRVRESIDAFVEHWEWLEKRRKQNGTHEGPFKIAPYYFFYAHRYAALAIELLPERDRAARRAKLAELLWRTREDDGAWNDRVFPRSAAYGTAMSMLALLAPTATPPAFWPPAAKEAKR